MARPRLLNMKVVEHAKMLAVQASTVEDLRCAQAVLLPALLDATLEQTATALGVGRARVVRYQAKVRRRLTHPAELEPQWGGRRREAMSIEEEREFLQPWVEQAADGGMIIVGPLRAALASAAGSSRDAFGGVSVAGAPRLAQGCAGYTTPQERPRRAGALEKKLPHVLAGCRRSKAIRGRKIRLMFQDEARFGRMVRIKRCWAQQPDRPTVCNGYEREFIYVYGAVSPLQGELDWMITQQMNTQRMSEFLAQVSASHQDEYIVMVVDGVSSHVSKDLVVPQNMRLIRLPPYAPELNPQEHVWDELREKEFPNRVYADLRSVREQLEAGLPRLASSHETLREITAWPWINRLNLNAH